MRDLVFTITALLYVASSRPAGIALFSGSRRHECASIGRPPRPIVVNCFVSCESATTFYCRFNISVTIDDTNV